MGKVLTFNGITAYGNGATSLIGGDELSDVDRARCSSCAASGWTGSASSAARRCLPIVPATAPRSAAR